MVRSEGLTGSQASHQVLREILKEVQSSMVPRTMLREWAMSTFQSATDYWTFRKVRERAGNINNQSHNEYFLCRSSPSSWLWPGLLSTFST